MLRASLGPPFAESRWFRFDPGGLVRKLALLLSGFYMAPDDTLPTDRLASIILLSIALVLIERTVMYVERAQDLAAGSESAELGLLPAWGSNARMQSLLLPALAKPILHDATLIFTAFAVFRLLAQPDDSTAFAQAAIAIGTCALLLLAYVCAALAHPRLADWPPQIVAVGILGYSACLWPLHVTGGAGAVASVAGAALALAACGWAASRHFDARRPFFFR